MATQALKGLKSALSVARVVPVLVNGAAGVILTVGGRPLTVMVFVVGEGRILEIDAVADPDRVARIAGAIPVDD